MLRKPQPANVGWGFFFLTVAFSMPVICLNYLPANAIINDDMAKPILGITGGVASGKSTVTGFLAERGACRVSADEIARELLTPASETARAVLAHFGQEVARDDADQEIDRAKLARRIFSDEEARRALGEIMHPVIRRQMQAQIAKGLADSNCSLIAAEIPLLYENRLENLVDKVLVARCPEPLQVQRLIGRQPWLKRAEALRQIRSQLPLREKAQRADYVIDTDQPLEEVKRDVDGIFHELTGRDIL